MNKNQERRNDLSEKFYKMGKSLVEEGLTTQDENVTQSGTMLVMLGNLIHNESDMFLFGEFCSMFSAKKILEDMEAKNAGPLGELINLIKNSIGEESPAPIKKVRKSRKKKDDDNNEIK